jgi:phytoene dehydrogenase-like protein
MTAEFDAIVIGGGLAGLTCARELCRQGLSCRLLEASDQVGGRVRTDEVDGFLLDRGFQVFLTSYPEARAILNYDQLKLHCFEPGALIRIDGKFHRFVDPWRRPRHFVRTALSPAATLSDKLRIAGFRKHTTRVGLAELYDRPAETTIDLLRQRGFSRAIIERFFRPFLGGVFLDRELQTSSRMCEFVFRMFSLGDATLPEHGMAQIPQQLASHLPAGVVRTATPVNAIEGHHVHLSTGERLTARTVIVATEAPAARRLLGDSEPADGRTVTCMYFAAKDPPVKDPILVLNGDGQGPINNLCVPSQVSPVYAPQGKSLVSVTVLSRDTDQGALLSQVRSQLRSWFGPTSESWELLKTYEIAYALPVQTPPCLQPVAKPAELRPGLFICGDHCDTASINGAMASGRRAAEAAAAYLGRSTDSG